MHNKDEGQADQRLTKKIFVIKQTKNKQELFGLYLLYVILE